MSDTQRTAIVTGASAGVGKEAARALLQQGWRVIGIGRDAARCAAAEADLRADAGADFTMLRADLSSMADTACVAREIATLAPEIDALLNNAGGVVAERTITPEGFEATFASNHLAPFLLTQKLLPNLRATAARRGPGAVRVIAVSSTGHEQSPGIQWDDLSFADNFVGGAAYCHAKLANILFTKGLARRLEGTGVVANCIHPGFVATGFNRNNGAMANLLMTLARPLARSPEKGAETLLWAAASPESEPF